MNRIPASKEESTSSSLINLLKLHTQPVASESRTSCDDRTHPNYDQSTKAQIDGPAKRKETGSPSIFVVNDTSDYDRQTPNTSSETPSINYKRKWEETEGKYRLLEEKYRQLENVTVKQLQDKVSQLERDCSQFQLIKKRISELCSCRQITNSQLEHIKSLVNGSYSDQPIDVIANKNDFHQQTIKLRDMLITHNNELLHALEGIIERKRKRGHYESNLADDDGDNNDSAN